MAPLSILLWIKIIGTFFPVALPLLVMPKSFIDARSGFEASDLSLYRLYGMAVLALLVGYAAGYLQVTQGAFPTGVLAMGFVSNAGAFAIMVLTGRAARTPFVAAFFGLIATGLAAAVLMPDFFMAPLW
ncbi:MAG: hypothetical protein AAFV59_05320 [Pseudomonadota bacterium]